LGEGKKEEDFKLSNSPPCGPKPGKAQRKDLQDGAMSC